MPRHSDHSVPSARCASGVLVIALVTLVACAAPTRSSPPRPLAMTLVDRDTLPRLAPGTNRHFAVTLKTSAPPAAVWAVWTAVADWPTWDTELASATLDGSFVLGATGRLVPRRGRAAGFRVSALIPDTAYTFTTGLPLAALHVRRVLVPAARADGTPATRITHEVWFDGLLGGLFASRFGPAFRAALPRVVAAVAARAERMGVVRPIAP